MKTSACRKSIPASHLRALFAFKKLFDENSFAPTYEELGAEMVMSSATARQSITYLVANGYLVETKATSRKWLLSAKGRKQLRVVAAVTESKAA